MSCKNFIPEIDGMQGRSLFQRPLAFLCMILTLLLAQPLSAQEAAPVTVKGFVTNQRGEPLQGVTIQGAGKSVQTGTDGSFALEVPAGTVLHFSYTGYADQTVTARNNQTNLKIQLQNKKDLDEVVVVGYGTRRKSEVTGSMVSVSEQSIRDIPTPNLASAMQGRAAGIDIQKVNGNSKPGAGVSILIRGSRSVRAGNDPLIVVDGIPFSGNFNDINPDDVTSVEILKDASATAIYGSRGANGVILVSTKRGKAGKAVITYSGYGGTVKPLGKYKMMDAQEFFEFKKWAYYNGRFVSGNNRKYSGPDDPDILTDEFSAEELESVKNGSTTDWQDLVYKDGFITDHQLGVSGGSESTQYAMSGGYYKETGIYPGQAFERFSLKLSVDHQLNKMFRIGLSSLNTFATTNGEGFNPMAQALRASPMVSPYDPEGKLRNDFVPGSASQVWNPLADFLPGAKEERKKRNNSFNTLYLDVNLGRYVNGLKYRFNAGAEIRSENYGNFFASKTTNNSGAPSTSRNRNNQLSNWTMEHLLNYDRTFAEKHKLSLTGLFSVQEQKNQTTTFNNNDILSDALEYFNPEYGSNLTGSGNFEKWALVSYMGRLNYTYDERYMLTATMRTDGSSRLAPGNKYKTFPSGALAWNIHNEEWFNVKAISNLRLRASYGEVGNASIGPYQTMARLSALRMNFGDQTTTGVYLTDVANANLSWEYTATTELGLDFGFLNNRITGTFGVYKQQTRDLLLPQTLPHTSGIQNVSLANVGATENKGIELQVSAAVIVPKTRNDFGWSVDANAFINRGKITKLSEGVNQDISNNWFVGQPIGVIYDKVKDGIWQNTKEDTALAKQYKQTLTGSGSVIGTIRYRDINNDGKMDDLDRVIIGSSQPKWQGGMTNRFTYRGFDLTVVAFARVGSTFRSTLTGGGFANTYQGTYNNVKTRFWTPDNHEKEFPKPNADRTNTQNNSLLGIFDGTYLKIRTISLGYTLAPNMLKKLGVRNLKLYTTVENPFIFFSPFVDHPFGGLDPETGGDADSPSASGQLNVDTPPNWKLIFGLSLSF
jgi:TonB-linked SusC/RagA family outer membrane protein